MGERSAQMNVSVVFVGFVILIVDGFDQAATAVTVPQLAVEWGLPVSAFTLPIVASNVGIVVGYVIAGWLASRIRAVPTLYAALLVAAAGSAASALVLVAESVPMLTLVRVVAGLGIGVVLPISVALTTSLNPDAAKERITALMMLGLIVGVGIGGLVGRPLLSWWGPAGVFWVATLVTLVVGVVTATVLPPGAGRRAPQRGGPEPTGDRARDRPQALLVPASRTTTLLLWGFALLVFVTAHLITSWTPAILVGYGFDPTAAPIGLAYSSLGAGLGGLALVWLVTRWGIGRAMTSAAAVAIVFLGLIALAGVGGPTLLLLLVGAGAGVGACQVAMLTMAVSVYPSATRTAGVGYAAAAGRVGSIIGPVLGGLLLALSIGPSAVVLVATVPVVIALAMSVSLARRTAGPPPTRVTRDDQGAV